MNPITLTTVAEPLIRQALAEDITNEDVSTAAIMPDARPAAVDLIDVYKRQEQQVAQIAGGDVQVDAEHVHMDDIRQQNSHDHEDRKRVLLHLVVLRQPLHGHEEREDGAAIERRDGQQVEEHKVQVDQREHGQEHQVEVEERLALHHPLRNGSEPVEYPRDHGGQHGEQ